MNVLFLDTASKNPSLSLCTEHELITHLPLHKHGDDTLVPAMEDALASAKWNYADLTHLACTVGPGGFTSLRIGVTAVNTLAHTLNLPSAGIHLSELWHARVQNIPQAFLWLHSTRKSQLFVKGFGSDGSVTPCALMELEEMKSLQGEYVGELIEEHKIVLRNCTEMPQEHILDWAEFLPSFLTSLIYAEQQILPWYGRDG